MNRRDFLKRAGLSALLTCSFVGPVNGAKKRQPNVIFIITDDQSVNSFGFLKGKALTPNIDRLAKEGVYFSRAYASSSVCTPSRYTCLTGRYASRNEGGSFVRAISREGQRSVHWNTNLEYDERNVAKVLRDAGYATGIVGKLHGFDLPGHSKLLRDDSDPKDPAVDRLLKEDQKAFVQGLKKHGFDYARSLNRGNLPSMSHFPDSLQQHSPEWTVDGALEFIEANKDKPFYLYFATTLLHGPSPLESLKSDPRITEGGLLSEPLGVQPSRQSVFERVKAAGLHEGAAPATWLDDSIGAILKKLEELKLTEDTFIIYFNDHGHEGGKGSLYEGGVRTPTMMYWPGTIKGRRYDELVENIDFVPTILSACGVSRPGGMVIDGMDLMPVVTGAQQHTRESIYCEIGYTRAVITKKWKYIAFRIPPSIRKPKAQRVAELEEYLAKNPKKRDDRPYDPEARITHINRVPGGDGTERGQGLTHYIKNYFDADQLYDLENDPRERVNLASDTKYRDVLERMKTELKKHLANVPGTFAEFKN